MRTKYIFAVAIISLFAIFIVSKANIQAYNTSRSTDKQMSGYAWNSNIGWISFSNCTSAKTGCSGIDYGVSIDSSTGYLYGYAWSSDLGWISFNNSDLSSCLTTCQPKTVYSNRAVTGWARIMGATSALNGYIALSTSDAGDGGDWGVKINPGTGVVTGYAWSPDIGWISFNCLNDASCSTVPYSTNVEALINPPTVTLTTNPTSLPLYGGRVDVTWAVGGLADSCTSSGGWSGNRGVNGGTLNFSLSATNTFKITCTNGAGSNSASATVTVAAPTVNLTANPSTLPSNGGTVVLVWNTDGSPTSCTATDGWTGNKQTADFGSKTQTIYSVATTTTYTLTCTNLNGSSTASATVTVLPPPTGVVTLTADPAYLPATGGTSTFTWVTTGNPTQCFQDSGTALNTAITKTGGSKALTIKHPTTVTVACTLLGVKYTSTATVTVAPPLVTLTPTPANLTNGATGTNLKWTTTSPGGPDIPTCVGSGGNFTGTYTGQQATTFQASVTGITSTTDFTLTCTNANGTGSAKATVRYLPATPVVTLTANTSGSSPTLTWTIQRNATSCTASDGWSGSKVVSGGTETITYPTTKTTYTLTCTNADGSGAGSAIITPASLPTVTLTASQYSIPYGGGTTLTWTTGNNPTSCSTTSTDSSWSGLSAAPTGGSQDIYPSGTADYIITCTNIVGSSSSTITVTMVFPPALSLSASPTTIVSGGSSTLKWNVGGGAPDTCVASGGWTGNKATVTSNEAQYGITSDTTYTLTCTNLYGSISRSVTVKVGIPIVTLTASPTTITAGGILTLTWTTQSNPAQCTASGGWSGNKAVGGGTEIVSPLANTSYRLTCTNALGGGGAQVNITIGAPGVTLTATPSTIILGKKSTLVWTTSGTVNSCTATSVDGSWTGSKATTGGSQDVSPTLTTDYIISCDNGKGTTTITTTVTVNPPPKPAYKEL